MPPSPLHDNGKCSNTLIISTQTATSTSGPSHFEFFLYGQQAKWPHMARPSLSPLPYASHYKRPAQNRFHHHLKGNTWRNNMMDDELKNLETIEFLCRQLSSNTAATTTPMNHVESPPGKSIYIIYCIIAVTVYFRSTTVYYMMPHSAEQVLMN